MNNAVVGMKFRFGDIRKQGYEFPWDVLRQQPEVRLEYEDDNPYDPGNAIKVVLPGDGVRPDMHIGYLPKGTCPTIREQFPTTPPPAVITQVGADADEGKRSISVYIELNQAAIR